MCAMPRRTSTSLKMPPPRSAVNAIAPFVLNAKLKPLMLAVPTPDKHIVHVSAMEGQFYRTFKTTRHPHTNMAKAALNMMTRTSAADFAKDGRGGVKVIEEVVGDGQSRLGFRHDLAELGRRRVNLSTNV